MFDMAEQAWPICGVSLSSLSVLTKTQAGAGTELSFFLYQYSSGIPNKNIEFINSYIKSQYTSA